MDRRIERVEKSYKVIHFCEECESPMERFEEWMNHGKDLVHGFYCKNCGWATWKVNKKDGPLI